MASRIFSSAISRPATLARSVQKASSGSVLARRQASHGPTYNQPSGYLFGEKPPAPGQKRARQDWETIYYLGMFGGIAFATAVLVYKPNTSIQAWAKDEAKRRLEESGKWAEIEYKGPKA